MYYLVTYASELTKAAHMWYARKCDAKTQFKVIHPKDVYKLKPHLSQGKLKSIAVTDDFGRKSVDKLFGYPVLAPDSESYGNIIGCSVTAYSGVNSCRVTALPSTAMVNTSRTNKLMNYRFMDRAMSQPGFYTPPPMLHTWIKRPESEDAETLRQLLNGEYVSHGGRCFIPAIIAIDLETVESITLDHPDYSGELCTFGACIDVFGCAIGGWLEGTQQSADNLTIFSFTLDFVKKWQHELADMVCKSPIPKTFSNGMYDLSYLLRWDLTPVNVLWDTEYWLRAACPDFTGWYSLQAQSNFYLSESKYWKDGRSATTRAEYHEYCGNDCHTTLSVTVAQLLGASVKNMRNYVIGYARVPYSLYSSLRGMELDLDVVEKLDAEYSERAAELDTKFRQVFGCGANQSEKILPYLKAAAAINKAVGSRDVPSVTSTDSKIVDNVRLLDPISDMVFGWMQDFRTTEKWLSTYIRCKQWGDTDNGVPESKSDGRKYFLWSILPFGTRTGRLSSKTSNFWVGGSAHTLPADMRVMMKAPKGKVFITTDAPQSESRVTAYESRCEALRAAVESDQDFHALNASAFFGIPYAEIYSDTLGKTINKVIRNLAKRTNHGANYGMGEYVMAVTMGAANVRVAQVSLNLPSDWPLTSVTRFLLQAFADTYYEVKNVWPLELVMELVMTGRVTCQVSGYSPVMLGNPIEFKPDLNGLISTVPQSTSAYISIKSAMRLFWKWVYDPTFPIIPVVQIHDEVVSLTDANEDVDVIDGLTLEYCSNAYQMKWGDGYKTMSIPVGDVAAGHDWSKLKEDAKKRTPDKLKIGDYA